MRNSRGGIKVISVVSHSIVGAKMRLLTEHIEYELRMMTIMLLGCPAAARTLTSAELPLHRACGASGAGRLYL